MNRYKLVIALLMISIGAALAIKNWPLRPATQSSLDTLTVAQFGSERYLIYLPFYVAIEEKIFEKNGIDVKVDFTGNDNQTFAAVVAGSADVGIGDPTFAAIAKEKGIDGKVIATLVGRVAIWGVAKSDAVPVLQSPKALKGLRIGTFPDPSTNFALMKVLSEQLGAADAPTIVQAQIGATLALLENNSADVAMELEPAVSVAEETHKHVVFSSPRMHGSFAFTGVSTTSDVLSAKRDILVRFVKSLDEATKICHSDNSRTLKVARKCFPNVSSTALARALKRMLDEETIPKTVATDAAGWEKALEVRHQIGDLKNTAAGNSVVVDLLKK